MLLVARFRTAPAATAGVIARGGEVAALLYVGQAMTIPMVLAILVIGSTVQVAGYAFVSRREWFGESSPGPVLPVVMFGVVFWCNTILDYFLGRQGDVMFLTLLCPRASEASLYDVAYSIVQVGLLVLTAGLGGVSLAALSRFAATDRVRMNSLYRVIVRTTSLLTIPLLAFILVRAPDILKLLFSDKYAGAASILRIILGMRILSRLFATGENADYLLALGKVWLVVRIGAIASCVTVGAHLILIPRWGAVGAACAGSAGVLLANIMGGVAVQRIGKIEWQWQAWIRIAAAAMVAGFLSGLIPDCGTPFLTVAATGFVFLIAFVLLATVLRPLYREDIDVINAALGRVALPMRIFARTR
jgi:O-antigen/teichoic acid export membrane protein